MTKLWNAAALGFSLCALTLAVAADEPFVTPPRDQFPIQEQHTDREQIQPDVAIDAQGNFVVVWATSTTLDADDQFGIRGKRFRLNGSPIGAEFAVNTYTTEDQVRPRLAMTPDGRFIVTWKSNGSPETDNSGNSIQARIFDASGSPIGDQFQVNVFTSGSQQEPNIAVEDDGSFIITWANNYNAPDNNDNRDVEARRFASDGTPMDDAFVVNPPELENNFHPAVSIAADGSFVVAWGWSQPVNDGLVYGQRFHSDGSFAGPHFQIGAEPSLAKTEPHIVHSAGGGFTVVWRDEAYSGGDVEESVEGRRFASDGTPTTAQFRISTDTFNDVSAPQVVVDPDGLFVAWADGSSSPDDIHGRSLDLMGQPTGEIFYLPSYTERGQDGQRIASNASRDLVIVWKSDSAPSQLTDSLQARVFRHPVVFTDGFELGDTSAWAVEQAP